MAGARGPELDAGSAGATRGASSLHIHTCTGVSCARGAGSHTGAGRGLAVGQAEARVCVLLNSKPRNLRLGDKNVPSLLWNRAQSQAHSLGCSPFKSSSVRFCGENSVPGGRSKMFICGPRSSCLVQSSLLGPCGPGQSSHLSPRSGLGTGEAHDMLLSTDSSTCILKLNVIPSSFLPSVTCAISLSVADCREWFSQYG